MTVQNVVPQEKNRANGNDFNGFRQEKAAISASRTAHFSIK